MLSLQTVLRAANVSLDDAVDKGRVFREKGIGILLTVEYTNKDSLDVWDSFALLSRNGPPLKYTYRARVLDFGESSSFKVTRMRYLNETENARVLYSATGVLLVVLAHGEMGVFDTFALALTFSGVLALLRLADLFICHALPLLYRLFARTRHVWLSFVFHTAEHAAPADSVAASLRLGGDDDAVEAELHASGTHYHRSYWGHEGKPVRQLQMLQEACYVYGTGFLCTTVFLLLCWQSIKEDSIL